MFIEFCAILDKTNPHFYARGSVEQPNMQTARKSADEKGN